MISIALDFFKSIDEDFYQKAKNVILNVDEHVNIEIININNSDKTKKEGYVKTINGKSEVYIPTQIEVLKKVALKDEICTLGDLITLVHELAHLLDLNYKDSLPTNEEILRNDLKVIEYKHTFTRELFGESTAIAFETLLMEYLMKETDYSNLVIIQEYIKRANELYDMTASLYFRLQLVKIKEEKNLITYDDLLNIAKSNGVSSDYFNFILRKTINDKASLTLRNRYVFAGAMSSTIIKKYHENGVGTLKDYLTAVREDKEDDVVNILGIDMDEDGIQQILENDMREKIYMLDLTKKSEKPTSGDIKEQSEKISGLEEI